MSDSTIGTEPEFGHPGLVVPVHARAARPDAGATSRLAPFFTRRGWHREENVRWILLIGFHRMACEAVSCNRMITTSSRETTSLQTSQRFLQHIAFSSLIPTSTSRRNNLHLQRCAYDPRPQSDLTHEPLRPWYLLYPCTTPQRLN